MKRIISVFLTIVLIFCMIPVSVNADEAQFVNIAIIHKEGNTDGVRKNLSMIEAGEDLLLSGEDLAMLGGFEYRIEKGNAYFSRGMKTLRVDLSTSRLYPFEDITLVGKIDFAEKVQEINGVYYFPGTEMLPWLNVTCFLKDGILNIQADDVSIWEIIPQFVPDEFAFDFTACCKELGVNGKYLKARAYLQDEGLSGMFFDLIPVVGDYLDYYDLYEDALQDQSASEKEVEDFLDDATDAEYWMEIADDFEVIDDLPDELRVFGEASKILANNAVSFAFELGTYVKYFYIHDKNVLSALFSMELNADLYGLPDNATTPLVSIREHYEDYYAGIGHKMMVAIGETSLDGLTDTATGLYKAAVTLLGFAEATSPDWAEGINRISSYDVIAEFCVSGYEELTDQTSMSSVQNLRGFAYMYLYSCEQNWTAMANYAAKEGKLDLKAKYEANADSAEEWQRTFMRATTSEQNDSHEYGDSTGGMKQEYTDKLRIYFSEVVRYPDTSSQEKQFTDFLQNHPEYNYYTFLDINNDGVIEMLATEKLDDRNGIFLSSGENVDLYISKDDVITLAYEDIRSKYTYLAYDAANQRLVSSIGGSGGSGISYISLDKSLTVQETSFESYCFRVDENGNEIWTKYYNGVEVNDETQQKYEDLYNSWSTSSSEDIVFQAVPKAALIGEWILYPSGIPHEDGYWFDVWISSLNLEADGTVNSNLAVVQSEGYAGYSGTWTALPNEDNEFILHLNVTGGEYGYFDEGYDEEKNCKLSIRAKLDDNCLVLEKISGDDIFLYYGEAYERDLAFETWVERQGPVENHITYSTLLWQYSDEAEYTLYDIDKDGSEELIIHETIGYNNDYYIYAQDEVGVHRCGDYYWSYSNCLYAYDGNGIVVHDGGTGSLRLEYVTLYSLANGNLVETTNLIDTEWHSQEEVYAYLDECEPIDNWLPVTDESMIVG